MHMFIKCAMQRERLVTIGSNVYDELNISSKLHCRAQALRRKIQHGNFRLAYRMIPWAGIHNYPSRWVGEAAG